MGGGGIETHSAYCGDKCHTRTGRNLCRGDGAIRKQDDPENVHRPIGLLSPWQKCEGAMDGNSLLDDGVEVSTDRLRGSLCQRRRLWPNTGSMHLGPTVTHRSANADTHTTTDMFPPLTLRSNSLTVSSNATTPKSFVSPNATREKVERSRLSPSTPRPKSRASCKDGTLGKPEISLLPSHFSDRQEESRTTPF
jgi:hypothetical protein